VSRPDEDLPPDVAKIKALLAMYLHSLPPEERYAAMQDLTQIIAAKMYPDVAAEIAAETAAAEAEAEVSRPPD
jgi:hypothetical protein